MPLMTHTAQTPQKRCPFTFLERETPPDGISVSLDGQLQEPADRQIAVIRSTGAQHFALARNQKSREGLT